MENIPKPVQYNEAPESRGFDRLAEVLASFRTQLDSLRNGSPERTDIPQQTAERVIRKAGRVRNIFKLASLGIALLGLNEVRNHATSAYEITRIAEKDGTVRYRHEDEETNKIMDFILDGQPLPEEDRIYFYQQMVREAHGEVKARQGSPLSLEEQRRYEKELAGMDEARLREEMAMFEKQLADFTVGKMFGTVTSEKEAKEAADRLFAAVIAPRTHNPNITEVLWKIQQKVGAPRVRWAAPGMNLHSTVAGSVAGPGRANYDWKTNTLYIRPGDEISTILAEDSHAFQFRTNPIGTRLQYVIDTVSTISSMIQNQTTWHKAQETQYRTPGSVEHEAHSVIEPQLSYDYFKGLKGDGKVD